PQLERSHRRIRVEIGGLVIADSTQTIRVLETSHPPVYYIPPTDVQVAQLEVSPGSSFCEWKGAATYYTVHVGDRIIPQACWTYLSPTKQFQSIQEYVAFYPSKMEGCYVDDERVEAQAGDFYGGWITKNIVGPFKGAPGTFGW
ncbi:MAG: DUF427 domain-containing protein, partial [Planctomycetota bacterium]